MSKLVVEKAEEPDIKLPTSAGSWKKQENPRKTSTASLTTPKLLSVWITTNWKILQDMGIPDHLTCLLRNLYAGQEAKVSTLYGTMTGTKLRKDHDKALYCHPIYLTYMKSKSFKMAC